MANDSKSTPQVRTGQGDVKLSREEFDRRLRERFYDPAFDAVRPEIDRVIEVAWKVYDEYHKSPRKRKAGPGLRIARGGARSAGTSLIGGAALPRPERPVSRSVGMRRCSS